MLAAISTDPKREPAGELVDESRIRDFLREGNLGPYLVGTRYIRTSTDFLHRGHSMGELR